MQCWIAWNQRNSILHGVKLQDPARLNQRAQDYLDEYSEMQLRLAIPATTASVQTWRPLSGSTFKLNFDAAVFANKNSYGFCVIIRNDMGEVMAGLSTRGLYVESSEKAKVLTCRKALEFAIDARFMELVVEGDNAIVMKSLLSPQVNKSRLGHIYEDVQTLATRFRSLFVGCIKRSANSVAHS